MTIYTLFIAIIMIVALLLILIVMVQNPKGGGLSSTFGQGSSNIGGVQNTNSFLDKSTWTLAITLLGLILLSNFFVPRSGTTNSILENKGSNIQTELPTDTNSTTTPEDNSGE